MLGLLGVERAEEAARGFLRHPLVRSLLRARKVQLEKIRAEGGGVDCEGMMLRLTRKRRPHDVLAALAQSVEQSLTWPAYLLAQQHPQDLSIVFDLGDGFAVKFYRDAERWGRRLVEVVGARAAELGVPTRLAPKLVAKAEQQQPEPPAEAPALPDPPPAPARGFGAWLARKRYVRASPYADVRPVGVANAGKPQLRIDEARRFVAAALAYHAETGHPVALAALLCLLLGLRTSEALHRQVRDLDDGGKLLWVPRGKNRNARRRLVVPEQLRPFLQALCEGKGSEDLIFSMKDGRRCHRTTMWLVVGRICERAGVPVVCSHSLRGLHSTLAIEAGVTSGAVAAALGHGSFAMTQRHYVAPGAVDAAKSRRVAEALGGAEGVDALQQMDDEKSSR